MRTLTGMAIAAALALSACDAKNDMASEPASDDNTTAASTTAAPPGETVFCPEIQQRIARANCDDLTETAARARDGVAAFNVPPMVRGKVTHIQLAIGNTPPPEEQAGTDDAAMSANAAATDAGSAAGGAEATNASDNATDSGAQNASSPAPRKITRSRPPTPAETVADQPGETESYKPVVGRHMRAELVGTGFVIVPRSPLSQDVAPDSVVTWEWDVTPQKSATYSLTIKTAVEGVTEDGKHYPLRSTVRNQPVAVTIPWYLRLLDVIDGAPLWLKSIATLLGALATVATAWWGLRRAFRGERPDGSGDKPAPSDPKRE